VCVERCCFCFAVRRSFIGLSKGRSRPADSDIRRGKFADKKARLAPGSELGGWREAGNRLEKDKNGAALTHACFDVMLRLFRVCCGSALSGRHSRKPGAKAGLFAKT